MKPIRKVEPIAPDKVSDAKSSLIPGEVIEAFNEYIVANWTGRSATIGQKEICNLIAKRLGVKLQTVFDNNWLDVEDIFRKAGWVVRYDQPAYNEPGDAYFEFSKR